MSGVIYEKCPTCGSEMEAEGIDVGIGYVYPPFHCNDCGYSEGCGSAGTEVCSRCDQECYCNK